jgi:hypothetical protein
MCFACAFSKDISLKPVIGQGEGKQVLRTDEMFIKTEPEVQTA